MAPQKQLDVVKDQGDNVELLEILPHSKGIHRVCVCARACWEGVQAVLQGKSACVSY